MKLKWKLLMEVFLGILLLTGIVAAGRYSNKNFDNQNIKSVKIDVVHPKYDALLHLDDVLEVLHEKANCCEESKRREINTFMLEESLDQHPLILQSEVFSSLNGTLYIVASLRTPVARVFRDGKSFYLDNFGEQIPLSTRYSAPVPLITGDLEKWNTEVLLKMVTLVETDGFFKGKFTGVHLESDGVAYLLPAGAAFRVRIGRGKEIEERLLKLKAFWENALSEDMATRLKVVDLQFKDQVVCVY
jgi:cell division protein FtsQ